MNPTYSYYVTAKNTIKDNGDGGTKTATADSNKVAIEVIAPIPIIGTDLSTDTVSYYYSEIPSDLTITASKKPTDAMGTLSYQWYKQGAGDSEFVAIENATSTTEVSYEYGTTITALDGTATVTDGGTKTVTKTSNTATITVAYGTFTSDMVSYASANDNDWYNKDVVITAKDGYTISTSLTGNYASSITISTEGTDLTQTYYVKNTETGGVCEATLEYSLDKTAPTATISVEKSAIKTVSIKTYGNTVNEITLGDDKVDSKYYTVGDEDANGITTITFTADYLKALDGGSYTFTISYNPMGETYVDETINDTPYTTTVTANIYEVITDTTGASEDLTIMYSDDEGDTYEEESISYTDAGKYTIYYQLSADNHVTIKDVITFTIAQADNEITGLEIVGWIYGEYDVDDNSPSEAQHLVIRIILLLTLIILMKTARKK